MAKLKVIKNMYDTISCITRREGDVFEVNDPNRVKKLLDKKVVIEMKEKKKD